MDALLKASSCKDEKVKEISIKQKYQTNFTYRQVFSKHLNIR